MVDIREVERFLQSPAYAKHTFTEREQEEAGRRPKPAEYFAARFAAKEAVFKSIAHLTVKKGFDLRIVETLNREDGSPEVVMNEKLRSLLDEAGVQTLHISITTETDYAVAFVVAED